jgi:membrane protein required for colicin V production
MPMFLWLDWLLLLIVVVSALLSLRRGFLREALSLLIWVVSVVLSIMFHEQLASLLEPYLSSPSIRKVAAIILLFTLCLIMGGLLSVLLSQLVQLTGLTGTDRLLGMIFGALRGVVVIVVLLLVGQNILPLRQELWWQQSVLIPHFLLLESWIVSAALYIRDLILPLMNLSVRA